MLLFKILFFMTCFFALIVWYNTVYLPANPDSVYLPPPSKK